jgi:DegV family protein with EDD domain
MVTIITDSTADLSPELTNRFQIVVVPLEINIENQTFMDGVNLTTPQLFQLISEKNQMPQTAAPSIGAFIEAFNRPGEIFFTGLSSTFSAAFQNATLAAQELEKDKVHLVDSLNLSTGIGLLVCKAAELRDQGMPAAQIAQIISDNVPKVHTSFLIETTDYLYKGGRCSAIQHLVGSLLKIRPIIEVDCSGKMEVKEKLRGTRKKALGSMLIDLENNLSQLDRHRIFVTHTGCDNDAQYLANEIKKICAPDEVCITLHYHRRGCRCQPLRARHHWHFILPAINNSSDNQNPARYVTGFKNVLLLTIHLHSNYFLTSG